MPIVRPVRKRGAFIRALEILQEHREGLYPEEFYGLMWPDGSGGVHSTKGGPSGAQCAANWLLGRVAAKWPGSVWRYYNLHDNRKCAGRWFIQPAGRDLLRGLSANEPKGEAMIDAGIGSDPTRQVSSGLKD